jgi:hypothetical protein
MRTLLDIRWLRVDGEKSINSRQLMVPYVVAQPQVPSSVRKYESRRHLLFVAAKVSNAFSSGMEERNWRAQSARFFSINGTVGRAPHHRVTLLDHQLTQEEFSNYTWKSHFCLLIPGDTGSSARLYKYMFSGCIPVVLMSSPELLPFNRFVNWTAFSVVRDVSILYSLARMRQLVAHLRSIAAEIHGLRRMRDNLARACELFDWRREQFPSPYHLALLDLTTPGWLERQARDVVEIPADDKENPRGGVGVSSRVERGVSALWEALLANAL